MNIWRFEVFKTVNSDLLDLYNILWHNLEPKSWHRFSCSSDGSNCKDMQSKWLDALLFTRICRFCSVATSHRLVLTTEWASLHSCVDNQCWEPNICTHHWILLGAEQESWRCLHPFPNCPKMVRSSPHQYVFPDSTNT